VFCVDLNWLKDLLYMFELLDAVSGIDVLLRWRLSDRLVISAFFGFDKTRAD